MYISELKLWNFRKYGTNGSFDLDNPDCNEKLFVKAVFHFLVAKKRLKEALTATLEKKTALQKLAMESGK